MHDRKLLALALASAVCIALAAQWAALSDPYAAEEDMRNLYWVYRWQDPALYPDERAIAHQLIEIDVAGRPITLHALSIPYSLIIGPPSTFLDPLLVTKLLAFPLLLASVYYLFRIIRWSSAAPTALAACVLFSTLVSLTGQSFGIVGGLHRSFALPATLALLYYLRCRRWEAAAIVLLSSTAYGPLFLLCAGTYIFEAWRNRDPNNDFVAQARQHIPAALAVLAGILLMLPAFTAVRGAYASELIPMGTSAGLIDPEFQRGGRYPLFQLAPLIGAGGLIDGDLLGLLTVFILALGALAWLIAGSPRAGLSAVFFSLLTASVLLFAASWAAILATGSPVLHMPNRFTRTTVFLGGFLLLTLNSEPAIVALRRIFQQSGGRLVYFLVPVAGLVPLVVFLRGLSPTLMVTALTLSGLLLVLSVFASRSGSGQQAISPARSEAVTISEHRSRNAIAFALMLPVAIIVQLGLGGSAARPSNESLSLANFLKTLPVETLVFGDPCALDDVPLYAHRSVLFSCETPNPDKQLMLNGLTAYYASATRDVLEFCRSQGIGHLVVHEASFAPERVDSGKYFYEPYDSLLAPRLRGGREFALASIPEIARVYQSSSQFVVPCTAEALAAGE